MTLSLIRKKCVLLIDDNSNYRKNLRNFLLRGVPKISIFESADGKDGYMKISRQRFELVITEVKLPKMDGNQLLKALKDVDSAFLPVRVLILSNMMPANSAPDPQKYVSYMSKADDQGALLDYVKQAIEQKRASSPAGVNAAQEGQKVDSSLVLSLIDGVSLGFSEMVGMPLKRGRTFVATESDIVGDIAGAVQIESSMVSGRILIAFPRNSFLAAVNKISGTTHETISEASSGFAKDLAQRAFQYAACAMSQSGMILASSEPELILGESGTIKAAADALRIAVQFQSPFISEAVTLEIQLRK